MIVEVMNSEVDVGSSLIIRDRHFEFVIEQLQSFSLALTIRINVLHCTNNNHYFHIELLLTLKSCISNGLIDL